MDIETFYLSSVSVAASLFSILLIVWAVVTIWLVLRIRKMFDKLDRLTDTTSDMAHNVNELVRTSVQRIVAIEKAFLTAQGMKDFVYLFATLFNNKKAYKKGASHEME